VVRRVATCVANSPNCALVPGAPHFQASLCSNASELGNTANDADLYYDLDSNLANLKRTQRDCVTPAEQRQYLTHIYFVANNDQAGDGIPTLKRAELAANFTIMPLAHGIENLQVEYGIDTDGAGTPWSGDGIPDVFTASPDTFNRANPAAPFASCDASVANCMRNWGDVMALRLHILARNTTPSQDHTDTKTYELGLDADGNVKCALDANEDGACEAFGDRIKRHVYQTSVRLNNPAGRRI
jgi:type IV pilus assembly protein PilW